MESRNIQAQMLDARALRARTFAEAQALTARADELRGHRKGGLSAFITQLIRN